jgi:UDP-N-acetylglucosamine 2-epimerase (non-hydrolysing)
MLLISYGTRPEWLKVKTIIQELKKSNINHKVLFTGQHKDIAGSYYDNFIEINETEKNRLDDITLQILEKINKKRILRDVSCVLVQGDTASVFAIALASMHRKIKIIHLEAGLRTYDKENPYPEEYYRQIVARLADYHLCPNENNATNLKKENINEGIFVIGNTVLDNLNNIKTSIENKVLITLHRRENLNLINQWFAEIENLAIKYENIEFIIPVHPNPAIKKASKIFKNVKAVNALNHEDLIDILKSVKLTITDSGGIQEEASFLRKKCIVCRKKTERQESINNNSILCKYPKDLSIIFKKLIKNYKIDKNYTCPYGNGDSSKKFINLIKEGKIEY